MYDNQIWSHMGPKPAWRVNFLLGIIMLGLGFGGLPLIFEGVIDWKFNVLDMVFNSVAIATFNVLSIYYRKLWFRTKRQRRPTLRNSLKEVALKIEDGTMARKSSASKLILTSVDTLIQIVTIALYPIVIIRKFFEEILTKNTTHINFNNLFKTNSTLPVNYRQLAIGLLVCCAPHTSRSSSYFDALQYVSE